MKRLLYVTPFSPIPQTEGHRKRILSTLNMISRRNFQVEILFACLDDFWRYERGNHHLDEWESLPFRKHFVLGKRPPRQPLEGTRFALDEWVDPSFVEYTDWLAETAHFDTIFVNYVFLSKLAESFGDHVFKICDTHDRFASRDILLQRNGSPVEFFYCDESEEAKGLNRFNLVLAIKEQEAIYFKKITNARVITLPYCEERLDIVEKDVTVKKNKRCRFGVFASANNINVTNLINFLRHYTESAQYVSGDRLDIAIFGSICRKLPAVDIPGVTVEGPIEKAEDFYDNVDCVLVPQEFSTGLKIKVAEAMAFGKAILAHTHALEGLMPEVFGAPTLSDLVDRCFEIHDKPNKLKENQQLVLLAKSELEDSVLKAQRLIEHAYESFLISISLLVDRDAIKRNVIYWTALRSICSRLSASFRISVYLCSRDEVEVRPPVDRELRNWKFVELNEVVGFDDDTISSRGVAVSALPLSPEEYEAVGHQRIIELPELFPFSQRLSLPPAARGTWHSLRLHSFGRRGLDRENSRFVCYQRWNPWEIKFRTQHGLPGFTVITLVEDCSNLDDELAFCGCARCAVNELDRLALKLTEGISNTIIVLDLTRDSHVFAVANELFALNGCQIFASVDDLNDCREGGGFYHWDVSSTFVPTKVGVPPISDDGWRAAVQLILCLADARDLQAEDMDCSGRSE